MLVIATTLCLGLIGPSRPLIKTQNEAGISLLIQPGRTTTEACRRVKPEGVSNAIIGRVHSVGFWVENSRVTLSGFFLYDQKVNDKNPAGIIRRGYVVVFSG